MLGSSSTKSSNGNPSENIRNIWANKFNNITEIIEINDNDDNNNQSPDIELVLPKESRIKKEPQIKKELLEDLGEDDGNIIMIDDEFDDTLIESVDVVTDTTVIDDLFGRDTLMADFDNINNVVMNDPENFGNPNMEIVTCPICEDRMARGELSSHLDGCNGITVKINPRQGGKRKPLPFYKHKVKPSTSQSKVSSEEVELLRRAGYTQEAIDRLNTETQEAREYNNRIMNEMNADVRQRFTTGARAREQANRETETITLGDENSGSQRNEPTRENSDAHETERVSEKHPCPVCSAEIDADQMNQHLDQCLSL